MLTEQEDTGEWGAFLEARRAYLLSFFIRGGQNREDAEDMVQETMWRALKFLPSLKVKVAAYVCLKKIAANVLAGWSRPGFRRELTGILQSNQEEDATDLDKKEQSYEFLFHPKSEDPETLLMESVDQEILMEALRRLEPRERTLLVLCYLQGMSHKEIGEELGMSPPSVKMAMMRARNRLRDFLDEILNPSPDRHSSMGGRERS